jgi:hypothetical protein
MVCSKSYFKNSVSLVFKRKAWLACKASIFALRTSLSILKSFVFSFIMMMISSSMDFHGHYIDNYGHSSLKITSSLKHVACAVKSLCLCMSIFLRGWKTCWAKKCIELTGSSLPIILKTYFCKSTLLLGFSVRYFKSLSDIFYGQTFSGRYLCRWFVWAKTLNIDRTSSFDIFF